MDAAKSAQMKFQQPATETMEKIIDLHHDIFSILLFLCIFVLYLLVVNVYKYNATHLGIKRNFFFKSNAKLEIA
jgi:heme/copper-type cytochrome/quinol oxidase subunit 2